MEWEKRRDCVTDDEEVEVGRQRGRTWEIEKSYVESATC